MKSAPAMMNETWPEFVTQTDDAAAQRPAESADRTGWETVKFELEDQEIDDLLSSAFSTAALAP